MAAEPTRCDRRRAKLYVAKARTNAWAPTRIVMNRLGIGQEQLRLAARLGLLVQGRDYVQRHNFGPLYCLEHLRSLATAIWALWDREIADRREARRLESLSRARIGAVKVSTAEKLKLAAAIRQSFAVELKLRAEIDRIVQGREVLQQQYFLCLWQRESCPHCLGKGTDERGRLCTECRPPAALDEGNAG